MDATTSPIEGLARKTRFSAGCRTVEQAFGGGVAN